MTEEIKEILGYQEGRQRGENEEKKLKKGCKIDYI